MSMLLAGCANADEPTFDSSNPVSCMVIFGVAANGAKQVSQPAVADEMIRRASFLAGQHGGLEWIKKVMPQSIKVGRKMEAAHDERATIRLLEECVAKQNADPHFNVR
ncbi:hypothetical protein [uncultured Sphingomonas sp.]|uniref:hypothetical protein n=1 Tax=uncultured Sphingomonas sp. TaxID=158754 RepID=UPI0035CCA079